MESVKYIKTVRCTNVFENWDFSVLSLLRAITRVSVCLSRLIKRHLQAGLFVTGEIEPISLVARMLLECKNLSYEVRAIKYNCPQRQFLQGRRLSISLKTEDHVCICLWRRFSQQSETRFINNKERS